MGMLIIDQNTVYEIDEECLKRRNPPKECGVYQALDKQRQKERLEPDKKMQSKNTSD